MADKKISELTELTTPDGTEELVVNDSGTSKKITQTNLLSTALPKAGGTMTGDVSLGDNVKATFGAGNDLQIYHNAGTSFITESGSGNFKIGGENLYLQNTAHNENYLAAIANQGVTLYYNSSPKLATTSTGIDVTGSVTCDGFTSTGIDDNATSTAITIDATKNVGIGTGSPSAKLELVGADLGGTIGDDTNLLTLRHSNGNGSYLEFTGERTSTGSNWTTAGTRIQQKIDSTYMGYIQFNGDGNDHGISFGNNNTERMRIDSAGDVTVNTGNLVIGTSGKGIDFSAATSDGTGTVTSEVLDDYETGTWSATFTAAVTAPTTAQVETGLYTKVGNTVTARVYSNSFSMVGSSGILKVTGLPFSSSAVTTHKAVGAITVHSLNLATGCSGLSSVVHAGATEIYFYEAKDGAAYGSITDNTATSARLWITITYQV